MPTPLLTTKAYIPPVRPLRSVLDVLSAAWESGDEGLRSVVPCPRLIEQLTDGLPRQGSSFARKLTLISAPAGFGKTTLVSEWIQAVGRDGRGAVSVSTPKRSGAGTAPLPVAWPSLDEGDSDLARFLAYFIAALQTLALSQVEGTEAGRERAGHNKHRVRTARSF